jgi:protein-L-isoaspartate(D-aspartate) O-methyltransferase
MDFVSARLNMVESQVRTNDVTDVDIADAMRAIHRERFCPPGKQHLAYAEGPVEYAPGRSLLAPRDVAKLVFSPGRAGGGAGPGHRGPYAAAMLGRMGLTVTALERRTRTPAHGRCWRGSRSSAGGALAQPPGGTLRRDVVEGAVARASEAWLARGALRKRLGRGIERPSIWVRAQHYSKGEDGGIARRTTSMRIAPYHRRFEPVRGFAGSEGRGATMRATPR